MSRLILGAPLAGWALPLDDVDDPVFAERMMGDGIAIDPLDGVVRSPAAGEVVAVAPTSHSVTLRLDNGAELLIHVGLETVGLGGRGFEARTRTGARVAASDELIAFDPEQVGREAKSLVTPIVLVSEGYKLRSLVRDRPIAAGEAILEVEPANGSAQSVGSADSPRVSREISVPLAHGIHARPAARIAAALKPFRADVTIEAHGRRGNARSTVALLTLGVTKGDRITISASGPDADAAMGAACDLIASGVGETETAPQKTAPAPQQQSSGPKFRGVSAAPGLAVGPVAHLRMADIAVPTDGQGAVAERQKLDATLKSLRSELSGGGAEGIAFAHRAILEDPDLVAAASAHIDAGRSAAFAWRSATAEAVEKIRATGDAFLIERIDDLIDVERRVAASILGQPSVDAQSVPDSAILVADTLLPSQFMALDSERIGGIVTARGGPTSHVAILAASAGVPMLVAAGAGVLAIPAGTTVVLDADAGHLDSEPAPELVTATRQSVEARNAERLRQQRAAMSECVMADGTRIEVFANLGSLEDAARAVGMGAEGCGLLRTEFLFLDRATPPSEEEQRAVYAEIAEALQGRPLIVRTLDIGGDKPVPYLDVQPEENPALGRRGVRLSLARPDLLATQLRAILSGVPASQCRIMVPMIVDVAELRAVRSALEEAARVSGVSDRIPLGVMVETPSAALMADSIAAEADFLSLGTNDLSQYALAVDRGNPAVADMVDALHPAVLRLIAQAAKGAAAHGRWLGVCGGLASDPKAAAILIGLGVSELSAVPAAIPAIKAAVRELTMDACRQLAERALALGTAAEVRALLAGEA